MTWLLRPPSMGSCSVVPRGAAPEIWVDFDLYGQQIVAHLDPDKTVAEVHNPVDGHDAPVAHFGVVMEMGPWEAPAERLTAASVHLLIEPHVRFKGEPGEQTTPFFLNPSGDALEFKAFGSDAALFAT